MQHRLPGTNHYYARKTKKKEHAAIGPFAAPQLVFRGESPDIKLPARFPTGDTTFGVYDAQNQIFGAMRYFDQLTMCLSPVSLGHAKTQRAKCQHETPLKGVCSAAAPRPLTPRILGYPLLESTYGHLGNNDVPRDSNQVGHQHPVSQWYEGEVDEVGRWPQLPVGFHHVPELG